MGLKDDLKAEIKVTLATKWDVQTTTNVPEPEDLRLNANHAKDLTDARGHGVKSCQAVEKLSLKLGLGIA
jgi:hypothetical protein